MKRLLFVLCIPGVLLFLSSCTSKEEQVRKDLIGTWQSHTLSVKILSGNNTNHDFDMYVGPTEWVELLRHLPINSAFRPDGTFIADYRKADGSHLQTLEGDWSVKGDSVYMIYTKPTYSKRTLSFKKEGKTGVFEGMVDFDSDTKFDDRYRAEEVKVSDEATM